ncbi:uncharacterized protein LOC119662009 [Teleopsis dalmanni]|uniref:uncharacterized protein LOC119662009 n=1 Tax=Teleopsis dalmanni TaxID=139649 RepID=UPI000D32BD54|nr:uncharacterized protein LOC119662009 [Teleopsis dalmanni]
MLPKVFYICFTVILMLSTVLQLGQCGPVPKVNEQQLLMPKIPQWHCLRYFKHDLLMMRRCRHVHVPTAPRMGDVKMDIIHK